MDDSIFDTIEETMFNFVRKRMGIFWARVEGKKPPYTDDPILQKYRFTNVFRVSDRVSQWMIRHVQYNENWGEEDLIIRTLLFKNFNLPKTWTALEDKLGDYVRYSNFDFDIYCRVLDDLPRPIFNSAYMQAAQKVYGYDLRHQNYLALYREMFQTSDFITRALKCKSLPELYSLIHEFPYMGDFLSYQYATDLNYTPIWEFDENEMALATIGSQRGIEKLLGGVRPTLEGYKTVIRFYVHNQHDMGFTNLFGRPLHPIDMQNVFCELDKYTRISHPEVQAASRQSNTPRIKNSYKSTGGPYALMFPSYWAISKANDLYTIH